MKYALPLPFVGYRGFQRGTRLVFLRREQDHYGCLGQIHTTLTFLRFRHFLETSCRSFPRVSYTTIVVREMVAVIASSIASPAEKSQVLQVADALPPNGVVVAAFKEGVANAQEPNLRQRLMGELLRFGDTSELPDVAHLLLTNTATPDQKMWLLYFIGNRVTDRRAVPALGPLLRSGDDSIRVGAVEALWHIADPNTVPELLRSLQDRDEQVRFYAVQCFRGYC